MKKALAGSDPAAVVRPNSPLVPSNVEGVCRPDVSVGTKDGSDPALWIILTVLLLITAIFFWPVWFKQLLPMPADALVGMYHPFRDYFAATNPHGVAYKNPILTDPILQQIPWKWLAIQSWKSGDIPRLNMYNFATAPLLANIQAGALYPGNFVFFLDGWVSRIRSCGGGSAKLTTCPEQRRGCPQPESVKGEGQIGSFDGAFPWQWTAFVILQPLLASIFMAVWLREHILHPVAVLLGSLTWAYSSFNLVWLEWGNIGHAGLWLPLALLAVDKIRLPSAEIVFRPLKWHLILQLALASSLFAGHLQVTLYLVVAVTLYWLLTMGVSRRSLPMFFVHCFLFIAVTSPQWIPTMKLVRASNREVEQADVLTREGFFINPKQLVQLVAPDFFGNPATGNYRGDWNYSEQVIYLGLIPLIFSLISLTYPTAPRSPTAKFAPILILGGLLLAVKTPVSALPYQLNLPLWSDLQPTRLSYLITFGLSVLSATGLDSLIRAPRLLASRLFIVIAVVAALLLSLLIISSKFDPPIKLISQRNLILPATLLMSFSFLALVFIWQKKTRLSPLFAFCFLFMAVADLFRFGWKYTPFSPIGYFYPITPAIRYLQAHMKEGERYMTLDRRLLPPNANIMYRLSTIEGYDPIYDYNYALYINELEHGSPVGQPANFGRIIRPTNYRSPVATQMNVRYVMGLTDNNDPLLKKVFQEGETRIYVYQNQ